MKYITNFHFEFSDGYGNSNYHMGFGNLISWILNGIVGVPIFLTFSLSFVFLVISHELKTGKMVHWMTAPVSKINIIISKLGFIFISLLFIYLPGFLITLITFSTYIDSSKYWGSLISNSISFIGFIFLMTFVFALIVLFFGNSSYVDLIVSIVILIYITTTALLSLMWKTGIDSLWLTRYISPSSLVYDTFLFNDDKAYLAKIFKDFKCSDGETRTVSIYLSPLNISKVSSGIFPVINILGASIGTALIAMIFNNKNLSL